MTGVSRINFEFRIGLLVLALTGMTAASSYNIPTQDTAAASERLSEARKALGGTRRLEAVKSLSMSGQRRIRNQYFGRIPDAKNEFTTSDVTINILFPNHYEDRRKLFEAVIHSGFSGDTLLNRLIRPDGSVGGTYPPTMINSERATFGYLALALLLKTDTAFPLVLRETAGDSTLVFVRPDGTDLMVDLDPGTGLPQRLRFDVKMESMTGVPTGRKVAIRQELSDFRLVDGVQLWHKYVTYRDGKLEAEDTFHVIEINPPLKPADFAR